MTGFKATFVPKTVLVTAGRVTIATVKVEGTSNYSVALSENPTWVVAINNVTNIAPPEEHRTGTYNVVATVTNNNTNEIAKATLEVNVIAREE